MNASAHALNLQQALCLIASNRADEALSLLDTIPHESQLYPHALHMRGVAYATSGLCAKAVAFFEAALTRLPANDELIANLARAYSSLGRLADALAMLDTIVAAGRATAMTLSDRAALLEKLERDDQALKSYEAALRLDPASVNAWTGRGNILHKMARYQEALTCHDHVIRLQPANALIRSNRASTLDKLGRMAEGLPEHRHAQALDPGQPAIWSGLGVCLVLLDRLEEGLHCFDQALAIDPTHQQAMLNRASVLAELQQHAEALAHFDRVLMTAPDGSRIKSQARYFSGIVRLALGDPAGWAGYEDRPFADQAQALHDSLAPRWSGVEPLDGKRILLWGEQGYGDVIQFCRYAFSLTDLGAKVILEVPAPLLTLCASIPGATVCVQGKRLPRHDFQIPMMSMPLALQGQPDSVYIPRPQGYLQVGARHIDKWKHGLLPETRGLKIGIACSGTPRHARNARRSIPLEALLPLSEFADLILLQPELAPDDSATAVASAQVLRPVLDIADFSDVAGLLKNVDLVISVDTSIAHLAGATGVPVWILLPWNAEWRWMTTGIDTPWYASARLFRQPSRGDWKSVIRNVLTALAERNLASAAASK